MMLIAGLSRATQFSLAGLSSQWEEKGTSSGQLESQVGLIAFREGVNIKVI